MFKNFTLKTDINKTYRNINYIIQKDNFFEAFTDETT